MLDASLRWHDDGESADWQDRVSAGWTLKHVPIGS
jgi:hypothetical protein